MQTTRRFIAAALAAVLALLVPLQAMADATVNAYSFSCAHFTASGTTDAAFVVFYVYDENVGTEAYWQSFPVSGGTFSHTVAFTPRAEGTPFNLEVWGSPTSDPNDYDLGDYFNVDTRCAGEGLAIPTLSPLATGILALLLVGSVAVVNSRRTRVRPTRRQS